MLITVFGIGVVFGFCFFVLGVLGGFFFFLSVVQRTLPENINVCINQLVPS